MSSILPILLLCFLIRPSRSKEIDTFSDGSGLLRRGRSKNSTDEIVPSLVSMDEMVIRFQMEMQGRRFAAEGEVCDVEQLKWLGQEDVDYNDSPIIVKSSDGSSVTIQIQNSFGTGVIDMYVGTQDGSGGEICSPLPNVDQGEVVADTIKAKCMTLAKFALITLQLDGDDLEQNVQSGDVVPTACCSDRGGYYSYPKRSYTFAVPCFKGCPDNPITPAPSPKPTEKGEERGGDTPAPVAPDQCECPKVKGVPSKCEVEILIKLMDAVMEIHPELAAQWLRASYHDAGTYNKLKNPPEGGAKGCLMNDKDMCDMEENTGLDTPMETLKTILNAWKAHEETCINISAADIIQFAGYLSIIRQRGVPGFGDQSMPGAGGLTKFDALKTLFQWGRPDEANCNEDDAHNLPNFRTDLSGKSIPLRCWGASTEIKKKMIDQNGFDTAEVIALLGAHTIGMARNVFGTGKFRGPWVTNGADDFSANGPLFDNEYFKFLIDEIVKSGDIDAFALDRSPFNATLNFGDWMQVTTTTPKLDWLDTDICIAFPPINETAANDHPNYRPIVENLANDNVDFLTEFDKAFFKQSQLGVTVNLAVAVDCDDSCSHEGEIDDIVKELVDELTTIDTEGNMKLKEQLEVVEDTINQDTTINGTIDPTKPGII